MRKIRKNTEILDTTLKRSVFFPNCFRVFSKHCYKIFGKKTFIIIKHDSVSQRTIFFRNFLLICLRLIKNTYQRFTRIQGTITNPPSRRLYLKKKKCFTSNTRFVDDYCVFFLVGTKYVFWLIIWVVTSVLGIFDDRQTHPDQTIKKKNKKVFKSSLCSSIFENSIGNSRKHV